MEKYVAEDGSYTGDINNPIIWVMVSSKLAQKQTPTCTLTPLNCLNGELTIEKGAEETKNGDTLTVAGNYTNNTEFCLAGK